RFFVIVYSSGSALRARFRNVVHLVPLPGAAKRSAIPRERRRGECDGAHERCGACTRRFHGGEARERKAGTWPGPGGGAGARGSRRGVRGGAAAVGGAGGVGCRVRRADRGL